MKHTKKNKQKKKSKNYYTTKCMCYNGCTTCIEIETSILSKMSNRTKYCIT